MAASDVLNIRDAPGTSGGILGSYAHNRQGVEIIALSDSGTWGQVVWEEANGWVSMRFLRERADQFGVPEQMSCGGTEPFWSLQLNDPDATFTDFSTDATDRPLTLNYMYSPVHSDWSVAGFGLTAGAGNMTGVLVRGLCSDGMSDRDYGWQLLLVDRPETDARSLRGCCTADFGLLP